MYNKMYNFHIYFSQYICKYIFAEQNGEKILVQNIIYKSRTSFSLSLFLFFITYIIVLVYNITLRFLSVRIYPIMVHSDVANDSSKFGGRQGWIFKK